MEISKYLESTDQTNAGLARELGVPPSLLSQWATGARQVPAERCLAIERATNGKVRCEDLRPDVDWTRAPEGSEGQPILAADAVELAN